MASDHLKLQIHTACHPQEEQSRPPRRSRVRFKTRLSFQERLLRNSFLACAVLLGILALGNVQQPWAKKAADGIEKALTMKVDLDESLGQLTFVRKLMPESAQVFFNLSADHPYALPVQGELSHAYDSDQPWLMFSCAPDAPVCAIADGVIAAVSPLSDGSYGVLIDHGSGLESVTACLKEARMQVGDEVLRGGTIGAAAESVYFELRQSDAPVDPSENMGL